MKALLLVTCITAACSITGCSQPNAHHGSTSRTVGGPCEGCEALFEYGSKKLTTIDTLSDFKDYGPKLQVTGTIYQRDGKTPVSDVILYVYHTNQSGIYPTKGNEKGWEKRHGYLRGWVKTDATGTYSFYTLRPAAYPQGKDPAHIHATLKEPSTTAYYLDDYVFDDDPLLTESIRKRERNRGGSGIIHLKKNDDGMLVAHRDIILGMNIPDY